MNRILYRREMREMRSVRSGLANSMTAEDVRLAIQVKTGCNADNIKVGTIRPGSGGLSAVWVNCLIALAKILGDVGRILVDFVSAKVTMLTVRKMRCFKCLAAGHTRMKCGCYFDCSGLY